MRTDECTLQMQASAQPVDPSAWKQRNSCSSGLACHPHACCAFPLAAPCCALRQAVPKAGSSHACPITPLLRVNCAGSDAVATVLVCLWYQTSSAHDAYHHAPHLQIHCIASDAAAVAAPQGITIYLTQHSN